MVHHISRNLSRACRLRFSVLGFGFCFFAASRLSRSWAVGSFCDLLRALLRCAPCGSDASLAPMTLRGFMALWLRRFASTFVIQGVGTSDFSRSVAVCGLNAFFFYLMLCVSGSWWPWRFAVHCCAVLGIRFFDYLRHSRFMVSRILILTRRGFVTSPPWCFIRTPFRGDCFRGFCHEV